MSSHDNDDASRPGEKRQGDKPGDGAVRVRTVCGSDRWRLNRASHADDATVLRRSKIVERREDAADKRETVADQREELVQTREDAGCQRESAAAQREEAVEAREEDIRSSESAQSTTGDQMSSLQQANANLVIATIEARKLAEQLQTAQVELDHMAHHDALTGLPNRVLLYDRLAQAIALAKRSGNPFAVLFLDLDAFKYINDSLGHGVGDLLLQSVGKRLLRCVRQSDTICRLGGDEFVALLIDINSSEDVALAARKMLGAIARVHKINQHDLHVSASIGISICPDDGMNAESLIKHADTAMYHSKSTGRSTYAFFKQEMTDRAMARQSTEASLRAGLERQEFVLHYQPQIGLRSGAIVGMEALVRWQHPQRGLLEPAEFVPVAEESGLILPLGRWVLREACRQAQAWQEMGLPPVVMAVNISALEFRAKDFLVSLRRILEETDLQPRYLALELTESVLMWNVTSTDSVLHDLSALGIHLSIDDFGTGYSSLSYLRRFPIDTLKMDSSFVNGITRNANDASLVSAMIGVGKSLKQRVVAEGVETAEQAAFLLDMHCDDGQGYFFGHPMQAEMLTPLLRSGIPVKPYRH